MHPFVYAKATPDKAAYIMAASGEVVTYRQLEERSNQGAHLLRSLGLKIGDVIAIWMDNSPRYLEVAWAAQRSGLYFVCISSKLTAGEAKYIIEDSGAKLLITSKSLSAVAQELAPLISGVALYMVGGALGVFQSWEQARDAQPITPIDDERAGTDMLYSSGTTGRPKGVKGALPDPRLDAPSVLMGLTQKFFGTGPESIYLSPAPLYHAAPLRWCMAIHRQGGTVVVMEKFDPESALAAIQRYRINTSQWVPTHFVRMLKLPAETRAKYDLSSLRMAVHAAAPCSIAVKQQMMDWWGPVLFEYYAGTEGNGFTAITANEWLIKKGSVGRALYGEIRVCDDSDNQVAPNTEGTIYFHGGGAFIYHNSPEKTAESRNRHGWTTLGDVGYVDEEGYLFLTDRKAFMIISGGVNIYPQEIENLLISHPKVMDVAVVGAPDEEMGEKVVAVVQPMNWSDAGPPLADELLAYARKHLSHVKVPRLIEFKQELPRHENGKLYKRLLRDAYWGKEGSRIV
jgi:long-chain acyl-CoA synthetase